MPDRPRYYLTTAIAYPNNKPGLHTLYEVIGADVIARWHRMKGDDTRFLTGTDEHSVNIAAARRRSSARTRRRSSTRWSSCSRTPRTRSLIAPDRFIRTTDPDHRRASQEMVRRAHANGDVYLGKYEGWYCPNEGFKAPSDLHETPDGMRCPNHPNVDAPVAHRAELVLPALGLPATDCWRTSRRTPTGSSPSTARTRCSRSCARASRTSPSAARPSTGASRSRSRRTARPPSARTARGTPRRASSTSGSTPSSTTSPAPASRTTRRRSRSGGRPTST